MQFEWNQPRAAIDMRKHRVAFADAVAVFFDPLARIFPDPDYSDTQEREIIVGSDAAARLLVISHVERHYQRAPRKRQ